MIRTLKSKILVQNIAICLFGLLLTSYCFAITASNNNSSKTLEFETSTLENGLQVIVVPNHRAPVVFHSIWYKVGSADSPYEKTGLAHFLEHLMFKGSKKFPGNTYKQTISRLGGEQNATTSWDRTNYFVTIAKEFLPTVIELEADRMTNLQFTKEDYEKERTVVAQERRQCIDSCPTARLMHAANASFFWHHPYGKPVIGFKQHIEQYTIEDVLNFYKTWYAPNNAVLILAGDVTLKEVLPLIKKHYGHIAKKPIPKRNRQEEPPHFKTVTKVELRDPQLDSMFFQKHYQAPNHRTGSINKEAAIDLLSSILGDNTNGRLYKALVEEQKIAHNATASYVGYFLDPFFFAITATPVNAIDFILLEAAVDAEVKRLLANGVTEKELSAAQKEYSLSYRYNIDSIHDVASIIGEGIVHGYTVDEIKNWLPIMEKVTCKEVNEAAKEVLENPASVVSYAYPITEN